VTEPRAAITDVVFNAHRALSPVEVFDLARQRCPKIGLVTVYRTLEKLSQLGLVSRVHQTANCSGYVAAPSGHQHLVICEGCGHVEYFSGDDISTLISNVEAQSRFKVQSHWFQLQGVCAKCQ